MNCIVLVFIDFARSYSSSGDKITSWDLDGFNLISMYALPFCVLFRCGIDLNLILFNCNFGILI